MASFVVRRLLSVIPVLLIVSVFVFLLIHLTPGDPAAFMLGPLATSAQVEHLRQALGLTQPLYMQYWLWFLRLLHGDLGTSIFMGIPVSSAVFQHAEPTVVLTVTAVFFEIVLGVPAGIVAATHRTTWVDQVTMTLATLGLAMPSFWLGLELIMLFGLDLKVLPVAGYVPIHVSLLGAMRSILMPAFSLGFISAALVARMTRSSMLEVLSQDFIRTARSKGLRERMVVWRHALRNAILPVMTVVGNSFAILLGGLVITEQVFAIPGIGRLVLDAVLRRDYPIIQGVLLYIVALYVLINVSIDVLYGWADPRIRFA